MKPPARRKRGRLGTTIVNAGLAAMITGIAAYAGVVLIALGIVVTCHGFYLNGRKSVERERDSIL